MKEDDWNSTIFTLLLFLESTVLEQFRIKYYHVTEISNLLKSGKNKKIDGNTAALTNAGKQKESETRRKRVVREKVSVIAGVSERERTMS